MKMKPGSPHTGP